MNKRSITVIVVLVLVSLLVIAWRGRGDGKLRETATATQPPSTKASTPQPPEVKSYNEPGCNPNTPDPFFVGSCAHETERASNCAAAFWDNGVMTCVATALPTGTRAPYPPPYP